MFWIKCHIGFRESDNDATNDAGKQQMTKDVYIELCIYRVVYIDYEIYADNVQGRISGSEKLLYIVKRNVYHYCHQERK